MVKPLPPFPWKRVIRNWAWFSLYLAVNIALAVGLQEQNLLLGIAMTLLLGTGPVLVLVLVKSS